MSYKIEYGRKGKISGRFELPASKSISNRVLIINALSGSDKSVANLAKCDDTDVMVKALTSDSHFVDIGAAGTSMRFLTAYLSIQPGEWIITGSQRMKERPIQILVDALRSIGADIEYAENEGFPPLKIRGKEIEGGDVEIDGSVSSQYISALMMIAPMLKKGLRIHLLNGVASVPYINLTLWIMNQFGADASFSGNIIEVKPTKYKPIDYIVESDWTGASYWFQIAVLADVDEIFLPALFENTMQGDGVLGDIFSHLGVSTEFADGGVKLCKKEVSEESSVFEWDFIDCPDLAQTVVVTCCVLNRKFRFTGLKSLKIKETNRILALQQELKKFGYILTEPEEGALEWNGEKCDEDANISVDTYKDHRMAMAFAPIVLRHAPFVVNEPEVVSKSYPDYWKEFGKIEGIKISNS